MLMIRVQLNNVVKSRLKKYGWDEGSKTINNVHVSVFREFDYYVANIFNNGHHENEMPTPDDLIAVCEELKKLEKKKIKTTPEEEEVDIKLKIKGHERNFI